MTLPDGRRMRNRRVRVDDERLVVEDRRTGQEVWSADILFAPDGKGRSTTIETTRGDVTVRAGCGCGGR